MESFTLDVQEIRRPESTFRIQVYWWSSVRDIKGIIHSITHEPPSRQHLYHSTNALELSNSLTLHDLGIEKSGRMLRIAIDYRNQGDFTITPTKDVLLDNASMEMVNAVRLGFQRNKVPTATDVFECSGGVYFLRNTFGSYVAVFKPHDEEQGMPNNPKDRVGTGEVGLREHFQPGQGCLRELAAYIMDYKHFSGVPATTLVHCEHPTFHYPRHHNVGEKTLQGESFPKLGSLQAFVHGADLFEDIGPSLLSDFQVQKIALLDIRLINCDRNAANILVQHTHSHHDNDSPDHFTQCSHDSGLQFEVSGSPNSRGEMDMNMDMNVGTMYDLIPIDHGYCMPSRLKLYEWDWTWFNYAHVKRPVHPDIVAYMKSIDIDSLLKKLTSQVALSDDSIFLLRLSHFLLLNGIKAGLTLRDIAGIMARLGEDDAPSRLEMAIDEAEENAFRSIELKSTRSRSYSHSHSPARDLTPGAKRTDSASNVCQECSEAADRMSLSSLVLGEPEESTKRRAEEHIPVVEVQCSHALNHSPMRPILPSCASWNNLSKASGSTLPSFPLEPIKEARRERGLSSLSSHSDGQDPPEWNTYSHGIEEDGKGGSSGAGLSLFRVQEALTEDLLETSGYHSNYNDKRTDSQLSMSNGTDRDRYSPESAGETPAPLIQSMYGAKVDMGGLPLRALRSIDNPTFSSPVRRPASPALDVTHTEHSSPKKQKLMGDKINGTDVDIPGRLTVRSEAIAIKGLPRGKNLSSGEHSPDSPVFFPRDSAQLRSPLSALSRATSTATGNNSEDNDYAFYAFESRDNSDDDYGDRELDCRPSPADPLMLTSDSLFKVPIPEALPLARVVSFSGFESRPVYSNASMRNMGNLRLERRRVIAESQEFKQLRLDFAEKHVMSIVNRVAAKKTHV
mmetsp:Transcript_16100/g.24266  ORF Transcript_16100/g.24266 Transcript_16100/m.24266 type:complete len:903 (-) Transcript_16100:252-2960(-)|eukprot:CAMPEP_0185026760 /NCGR_PEP_ID=MMETSP1103-20130426/11131_1 /TAXON_ID=36769 /ORGANISM="Paraphysomonas bandaiensis, Strain Caron Lab Isolate" /LENGTH=902 /DNA_ID=CAMNT_0027560437 /DNA_START=55 /DNA_END=2763 /DNA_ORIENTATION=-